MMTQSQGPVVEFNFSSVCSTPYVSAPSSPQRFFGGSSNSYFYSAPASPARISASSTTLQLHLIDDDSSDQYTSDFAFDFSGHLEPQQSLSADELFHRGVIKPLQVPAALQPQRERGRSTMVSPKKNSSSVQQHTKNSSSRSLSPSTLRVSDLLVDGLKEESSPPAAWYSKLSLMFRSKSEGSAASNKNKWATLKRRSSESSDIKNTSMRRKGMSSHEWHYTVNRAASEEMRKKTLLPYKQHGWLGCLGFSPVNFDASLLTPNHHHSS